jgi:tRNA threonylcarbamoyladenosine biosynthesis protein TsaB
MKILAFEFSSPQRSVALVEQAETPSAKIEVEAMETGTGPNKPFGMIEQVLKQARLERNQIEGLVIGLGPGSYTGIRSSIALAQGWQLGRAVQLQGVSSAECLAAQAHSEGMRGLVGVVIDAQRGEFYLATYEMTLSGWRELQPLALASPETVTECETNGAVLIGPEVERWFPRGRTMLPRATVLGRLALSKSEFVPGEHLEPIYLRTPNFVKAPPPRILPQ